MRSGADGVPDGGSARGLSTAPVRSRGRARREADAAVEDLHVYWSITSKASSDGGFPIAKQIQKAKDALSPHGLTLTLEFGGSGFADTINFPYSLVLDEDVALLRKASEATRAGAETDRENHRLPAVGECADGGDVSRHPAGGAVPAVRRAQLERRRIRWRDARSTR